MHRYIPLPGQERRLQENRRESGAPSGTQIRKDQVRAEPFCKRVSGLAFPLVPFPVRHQAHALFGLLGSLMFIFGFIAVVIVGVSKLYYMHHGMPYRLVTDSPYFYLSLTSMIIGTQLFVAGFLGELISRNAPERNKYQIETI